MKRLTPMQLELNMLLLNYDNACVKLGVRTLVPEDVITQMFNIFRTTRTEEDKMYFKDVLRMHVDFLYLICMCCDVSMYGYIVRMGILEVILPIYLNTPYEPHINLGRKYFDFNITFDISDCFKIDGTNTTQRIFMSMLYDIIKTVEYNIANNIIDNLTIKLEKYLYDAYNISILLENSIISGLVRRFFPYASSWGITNEYMFGYNDISHSVADIMSYGLYDNFGQDDGPMLFYSLIKSPEAISFDGAGLYGKFMDVLNSASSQVIRWCDYVGELRHLFIYIIVASKYRAYRVDKNIEFYLEGGIKW